MLHARKVERPVSRSEMAEVLGVSRSKVSMEVGRLIEAGLLVEDGLAESDGGRRSSLLRIPRSAGLVACVDLGATSTDVALATLGGEILVHGGSLRTSRTGRGVCSTGRRRCSRGCCSEGGSEPRDVLAVGVGVPGPSSRHRGS